MLAHVGSDMDWVAALGFCGGSTAYLLTYVALRLRVARTLRRGPFTASVAFALLVPVAVVVPGLLALALVAVVWLVLHAYELIWWREERAPARLVGIGRGRGVGITGPSAGDGAIQ